MNDYYTRWEMGEKSFKKEVTLKYIINSVIKYSGFDITMKKKNDNLVLLRQVYYKLARKHTKETHSKIGAEVGKNYATVLHALSTVDKDLKAYPMYNDLYKKINYKIIGKKKFKVVPKALGVNVETSVLKELNELSDVDMTDFKETRLKPYLSMLKSRRKHKTITEVKGALLRD